MRDISLSHDSPDAGESLAGLPQWFTEREVIPLDDNLALVVCHEAMRTVAALCRSAAERAAPVLLTGETGVGKSLFARFIHASRDPYAPFVSRMTAGLEASTPLDVLRVDPDPLPVEAPFPRLSLTAARLLRTRALHLAVAGDATRAVLAAARAGPDAMTRPVAAVLHAPGATVNVHWSP